MESPVSLRSTLAQNRAKVIETRIIAESSGPPSLAKLENAN